MKKLIYLEDALNIAMQYCPDDDGSCSKSGVDIREMLDELESLPSVQPQPIVGCKDCMHWRDSDGVYRRGADAESKCPLNTQEVYAGTFYCGYAERRTDE